MIRCRETAARATRLATLATLALLTVSCDTPTTIQGSELGTYLAAVAIEDIRGVLMAGPPPAPGAGPSVTVPGNANGITGGSTRVDLVGSGAFRTVAIYVDGVDGHYLVRLAGDETATRAIFTIGGRVPVLDLDLGFAVANASGVWGPRSSMAVSALQVAGGDIQISASWETTADVDLHVVDPTGEEIYYGNRTSNSGGELDIDANAACGTSSIFQENIGWDAGTAPSGQYIVRLDYWSACNEPETEYIVTVYLRSDQPAVPGSPGTGVTLFTGTFLGTGTGGGAGDGRPITTFTF